MWQMSSLLPSMTEWPSETNEYLANRLEYEEIVRWDTENVNNMYVFGLKVFWVYITLEVPGNVCKLKNGSSKKFIIPEKVLEGFLFF